MKKLLTLAIALCFSAITQAVHLNWVDYSFEVEAMPAFATSFIFSGTSSDISDALTVALAFSNGTTTSGWTQYATGSELTEGVSTMLNVGTPIANTEGAGVLGTIGLLGTKPATSANYYMFLLSEDGTTAWIANLGDITSSDVTWTEGEPGGTPVTGLNKVTLVQQTVPEPTAFALIALGVAGLALRRRTK